MKNYEYTFDEYATKILPRRVEMIESLLPNAFKISRLFGKGVGEKGVIKRLGRMADFKGIYLFIKGSKVVYIGTSEKVINRLVYHIKGHTKYQAHLAWEIAKDRGLWVNKKMEVPDLDAAKAEVFKLKVLFLEITSPVERYLIEAYAAMHFECKFNYFESR
ncbi:hypothetical protein E1176_04775 [Fulvivirga sp. RKSG066]|uniref:hypothetical protein n=1 Tax=Fulvivirga aurantia TaxID=2529383 RepID=UPI0012BC9040|nr:hypothetical protein [Fulvivirga aurantia]MTI20328.1 hypothetical protein [Fulvivirga aurantia]